MTRRFLVTLIGLLLGTPQLSAQAGAPEINVMTFNIRYAHTTPPNLWPDRRELVSRVVVDTDTDIVGMQEVLWQQLKDIDTDLPDDYKWIGLGREGGSRGEFMAVFYKSSRFDPIEYDHFWLSDTPMVVGSEVEGACCPRMITWIRFRDLPSGREFYFVNTHLDNSSQPARDLGARLLIEGVAKFDPTLPVIVTGDFNSAAASSPVYQMLVTNGPFRDTWTETHEGEPPIGTSSRFQGPQPGGRRIDWILTVGAVQPLATEIRTDNENGQYPSDHFPVTARVELR